MRSFKRMFLVKKKNFRLYNLLNLSINSIICLSLILTSLILLISRNSNRDLMERSLDDSLDNRVRFFAVERKHTTQRSTKPPLKDSILNVSNFDGFKSEEQMKMKEKNEEIKGPNRVEEEDYKDITKSEEEFDRDDEFHPPSGNGDLKKKFENVFNMFRKSKPDEGAKSSSKAGVASNLPTPEQKYSPSQSFRREEEAENLEVNQKYVEANEDLQKQKEKLSMADNVEKMVLIKEIDQVDFADEIASPTNEREETSLDHEYIESESLVQRPFSETLVSNALQDPLRKEASEEVKKIFETFSRRKKTAVGMGDCSKLSRVGCLIEDREFHPDNSQYLCDDPDFEGHFKSGCIIYSFGANGNWDFENTTANKGCKVWVYDVYTKQKPENLANNIQFFHHGLGPKNEKKLVQNEEVQFSTLEELITQNNHKKSFISYVKLNLRGGEWQILDQIMSETPLLANNILQMGLTLHLHQALVDFRLYKKYLNILNKLTALGFQLFLSKEVEIANESYKEPLIEDKTVFLTNYLAFFRL